MRKAAWNPELNVEHCWAVARLLTERGSPGDYEEAEKLGKKVVTTIDAKLGKDSPQSLSGRRTIVKAIWMQGRIAEAERLIAEIFQVIDGLSAGKYAVYQEEEQGLMHELVKELKVLKQVN